MTIKDRLALITKPIEWTGDLSDDCTALWAGLMLRAEWMNKDYWWWAVYDMEANEITVDDSTNYSASFKGGQIARQNAESVAQNYIFELIKKQCKNQFIINDAFKITRIGLVLVGYILEGSLSTGDKIIFIALNKLYVRQIIDIEGMTVAQPSNINKGLKIQCENETEIDKLRNWNPNNYLAIVFNSE